jgi:spore germination cell wall hydrolase CwlJ-like protein
MPGIRNSSKLNRASAAAVAASLMMILISANGSGAAAETKVPVVVQPEPSIQMISEPVIQPLPLEDEEPASDAASLADLVAAQPQPEELSHELSCLAGAIYFESKGESLEGQLAVGRVIVARTKSGRFPETYCGVVYQPSQFSFVRGKSMPTIAPGTRHWKNAVAIAQIAHEGSWQSPVEGALFFHATYVSPGWRLKRMARIDNHVFYR